MNIAKAKSGKWFEDQYSLTDLLSLSVAVNRINGGYIKKDADIDVDNGMHISKKLGKNCKFLYLNVTDEKNIIDALDIIIKK